MNARDRKALIKQKNEVEQIITELRSSIRIMRSIRDAQSEENYRKLLTRAQNVKRWIKILEAKS